MVSNSEEVVNEGMQDWLTPSEVAEMLRTSVRNVQHWAKTGQLKTAGYVGRERRFRRSDVAAFVKADEE